MKELSQETLECLQSFTGLTDTDPAAYTPQDCLGVAAEILDSLPEDNEVLLNSFRILSEVSALAVGLLATPEAPES